MATEFTDLKASRSLIQINGKGAWYRLTSKESDTYYRQWSPMQINVKGVSYRLMSKESHTDYR